VGNLVTPINSTAAVSLSRTCANEMASRKSTARLFHSALVVPLFVNRIALAVSFLPLRNSVNLDPLSLVTWLGIRSATASESALAVRAPL